jgi:hypothetical protein
LIKNTTLFSLIHRLELRLVQDKTEVGAPLAPAHGVMWEVVLLASNNSNNHGQKLVPTLRLFVAEPLALD